MGKIIDISEILKRVETSLSDMDDGSTEYGNLVRSVETRLMALHELTLPEKSEFNNVPIDYNDMRNCKVEIEDMCTSFTVTIHSQLLSYPGSVKSSLDRIDRKLNSICKTVKKILDNGNMSDDEIEDAILDIADDMKDIVDQAGEQVENLNQLINNLDKFANQYTDKIMADINRILDDVKSSGDEYKKIADRINEEKDKLKAKITTDAIEIATAAVVVIAGVVGVCASLALLIPSGGSSIAIGLSVICGLIAVGGGLVAIGLDSHEIDQCKKEIQSKIDQLDDLEKDKLLLQTWNDSVQDAKDGLGDLKGDVIKIKDSWVNVKDGFDQIIDYITDKNVNPERRNWEMILEYMEKCQAVSKKIRDQISKMILDEHKVSKAKIEVGMTKEQIEEAIKSAEMVSFKEYMLAI